MESSIPETSLIDPQCGNPSSETLHIDYFHFNILSFARTHFKEVPMRRKNSIE